MLKAHDYLVPTYSYFTQLAHRATGSYGIVIYPKYRLMSVLSLYKLNKI